MRCPKCEQAMVDGYSVANAGLSWIEPGVMQRRVFRDKDLADAGLKKYLPWKGCFFRANLC